MSDIFKTNGANFSECRKYRYALWRIWDDRKPLVMFIGLNPSTANDAFNAKKGKLLVEIPATDSKSSDNSAIKGLIIGIDPDIDKNGVAIWNPGIKVIELHSLTFFQLFEHLQFLKDYIKMVKIEAGWNHAKKNFHGAKNSSTAARIGANVGANHDTGKKIVEMCQYLNIPYREVKPLKKTWKNGKISHEELQQQIRFRGLREITGRTNQEMRDAALICFNG